MLYPFMTLNDETEIVHSESMEKDGREQVKVVIEKPVMNGCHFAICWLPDYRWESIQGFTPQDIEEYQAFIASVAHVIIELARDGGFSRAASF